MRAFKALYLTVNQTMHAFRHGRHGPLGGGEAIVRNALSALDLKEGMIVADLGSGPGRFTIPIAKAVGAKGKVYAIDIDEGSLKELSEAARSEGLSNVETIRADLTKGIPLPESHLDLAFMANVLHDLVHSGTGDFIIKEVERVLKPGGTFAVLEFKKSFTLFGPPLWLRLSPEEVLELVSRASRPLRPEPAINDIGEHHYLLKFRKLGE